MYSGHYHPAWDLLIYLFIYTPRIKNYFGKFKWMISNLAIEKFKLANKELITASNSSFTDSLFGILYRQKKKWRRNKFRVYCLKKKTVLKKIKKLVVVVLPKKIIFFYNYPCFSSAAGYTYIQYIEK